MAAAIHEGTCRRAARWFRLGPRGGDRR